MNGTEFDQILEEPPAGAITEIFGAPSSGRTSLLFRSMAQTTSAGGFCGVVDSSDAFSPEAAAKAGVELKRLIWIRCAGNAAHALKAADLLVQGGGFRMVVLDLADIPLRNLQRIPLSYWFRFRRAVEHTPSAMVVLSREPQVRQSASVVLEMRNERVIWAGMRGFELLRGARLQAAARKPVRAATASFEMRAVG